MRCDLILALTFFRYINPHSRLVREFWFTLYAAHSRAHTAACIQPNRKSTAIIERERQKARRKDEMTHGVSCHEDEQRKEEERERDRERGDNEAEDYWRLPISIIDFRDRPTGFTCPGRRVNDDASLRLRTFKCYANRLIYRHGYVGACDLSLSLSPFFYRAPQGPRSRENQQPR